MATPGKKPKARKAGSPRRAGTPAAAGHRVLQESASPFRFKLSARAVADAMDRAFRARGSRELLTIKSAFQLSSAELGELFGGVSRQAVEQWMERGVPIERAADVDRIAEVTLELRKRFKQQRLPAIARRPMTVFGNRSILTTLKTEGVGPIHEFFRRWEALVPGAEPISVGDFSKSNAVAAR